MHVGQLDKMHTTLTSHMLTARKSARLDPEYEVSLDGENKDGDCCCILIESRFSGKYKRRQCDFRTFRIDQQAHESGIVEF